MSSTDVAQPQPTASPDLTDDNHYAVWRAEKLRDYPRGIDDLVVPIRDLACPTPAERRAVSARTAKANMAIYDCGRDCVADKTALRAFGARFGLNRLDGNLCADEDSISTLRVMQAGRQLEYIPYSDKPLNWHTDGYYNAPGQRIQAFLIHCVSPAPQGGDNALLDPEMVYLLMRDAHPEYVRALMHPEAMRIPANFENGVMLRPEQGGPVFSFDPHSGRLHMRYTARKRNIIWRQDPVTLAAVAWLEALINSDNRYIFHQRLAAGQGIICNNVLHNRSGFSDDPAGGRQRIMLRARYYERISDLNDP
jgi:hypothetical protein